MTSCLAPVDDTYKRRRGGPKKKKRKAGQELEKYVYPHVGLLPEEMEIFQPGEEDKLCFMADIQKVVGKLFYKDALVLFYLLVCKHTYREVGDITGIHDNRAIERIKSRSIKTLCYHLNGGSTYSDEKNREDRFLL